MCDPISIGAGAALAGGTLMSGLGKNQGSRAAYGAMNAEAGRQRTFRDAAAGQFNKTLDAYEKPVQTKGLTDAQGARTATLKGNVTNFSGVPADGVRRAPKIITDAYARGADASGAYGADYAGRTGALEGYGDQAFSNNVMLGRSRGEIDKVGNFSRGSQNVLPIEIEGAQRKGSTMRGIGEIFQGLGNLGLMYGFTRPLAGAPISGHAALKSAGSLPGVSPFRVG